MIIDYKKKTHNSDLNQFDARVELFIGKDVIFL